MDTKKQTHFVEYTFILDLPLTQECRHKGDKEKVIPTWGVFCSTES